MPEFRIDLKPARKGDAAVMRFKGTEIGTSRVPVYAAARYLLARGIAGPDDTIATYRSGVLCLRGNVAVAAKLTVVENDSDDLRVRMHQEKEIATGAADR